MPTPSDTLRGWRTRLQVARDPGILGIVGAVLLMCAPVLPGFSRLVVLPALLLAPGYALLRLLGHATGMRTISVAVPVSLALSVCGSLLLGVAGIRLDQLSLGLMLGGVTALLVVGSYRRQLAGQRWWLGLRLLAGLCWLEAREYWANRTEGARFGPRHSRRPPHGDELRAPDDHPSASHALRAMFTRDFVYLGVSALQVVLTAALTPILTRLVSVGEYGQLALAVTVAQLLAVTFSFGLPFAAQKVFAGEDGDQRSRGVLAISAALAIAAAFVFVLAAPAWGPAVGLDQVKDAFLVPLLAACWALTLTSLAILRSRDKIRTAILVAVLQTFGAQGLALLLLYWWAPSVTAYLFGLIIGQGVAALAGLLALTPDWSALAAIRRHGWTFAFGLPMVPQQLCGFVLAAGDRIVVRHVLGSAAVGRYAVAYNVGSLGFIVLAFVNQAWMPRIYAVSDRAARSRLLASSRDMLNLLLIPVVCGLAAGAPIVLRLWAPKSFHPAELTPIVAIVAICTFPYGHVLSNLRALLSEGRTGRAAVTTLIAAVVNIGLNVLMVPYLGIAGSAIATVIAYGLLDLLTRPPVDSGLPVPGASVLLSALTAGAIAVTLAIGTLPTSSAWLVIRLAMCAVSLLAFALLIRRATAGLGIPGRLVTPVVRQQPGSR